jgi:hypothetical protein
VSFLGLIIGILGVWRVTHLLHAEAGPWQLSSRLRRLLGTSVAGEAIGCFNCLSLWVAAPFALWVGASWADRALLWPALSAGAIVLDHAVSRLVPPEAAIYNEDPAED